MMMAEEIRKWFHEWRRRNTVSGDFGLHRTCSRPTDGSELLVRLIHVPGTVWQSLTEVQRPLG
jgi:hypothetical protein